MFLCEYIIQTCLNDCWHFLIDCGGRKKSTVGLLCMLTRWPQSLWRQRRLTCAFRPCQVPRRRHKVSSDFTFVLLSSSSCALSWYPLGAWAEDFFLKHQDIHKYPLFFTLISSSLRCRHDTLLMDKVVLRQIPCICHYKYSRDTRLPISQLD